MFSIILLGEYGFLIAAFREMTKGLNYLVFLLMKCHSLPSGRGEGGDYWKEGLKIEMGDHAVTLNS